MNIKISCTCCNKITNHTIIYDHNLIYEDVIEEGVEDMTLYEYYNYQIIKCNGCDDISFRKLILVPNSIEKNLSTGKYNVLDKTFETLYPERKNNMLIEKKITGLPFVIKSIYREILDSYNSNLLILCAAGMRAIVEGICVHYRCKGKTLNDKIEELFRNGLINKELANSLQVHRFLGNRALHQLEIPEKEELQTAIYLIEMLLETLFELPRRHRKLQETVTKRVSK